MKAKTRQSRILKNVHESAQGLYKAGLISPARMRHFDDLCLEEAVHAAGPKRVEQNTYRLSKAVRASLRKASHALKPSAVQLPPNDAVKILSVFEQLAKPNSRLRDAVHA
ncbi:MAG: hypothetical protein ACREKE_05820 [bacterium]